MSSPSGVSKPLRGEVGDQAGLRQDGDVGRAAGLRVDDDLLLVVLRRGVFDVDAGGFREIGEHAADELLVLAAPRPEDRQRLALEVDLLELFEIRPIEAFVLARLEFQLGLSRRAQGERRQRDAQQKLFFIGIPPSGSHVTGRDLHPVLPMPLQRMHRDIAKAQPGRRLSKALWLTSIIQSRIRQ